MQSRAWNEHRLIAECVAEIGSYDLSAGVVSLGGALGILHRDLLTLTRSTPEELYATAGIVQSKKPSAGLH